MNYSFVPMSAPHFSDIFSMPVGAALAPESTGGRIELDSAFAGVLEPVVLDAGVLGLVKLGADFAGVLELDELDVAFDRSGIVDIGVRAEAAVSVATCGLG